MMADLLDRLSGFSMALLSHCAAVRLQRGWLERRFMLQARYPRHQGLKHHHYGPNAVLQLCSDLEARHRGHRKDRDECIRIDAEAKVSSRRSLEEAKLRRFSKRVSLTLHFAIDHVCFVSSGNIASFDGWQRRAGIANSVHGSVNIYDLDVTFCLIVARGSQPAHSNQTPSTSGMIPSIPFIHSRIYT